MASLNRRHSELAGLTLVAAVLISGITIAQVSNQRFLSLPPPQIWLVILTMLIIHLVIRRQAVNSDQLLLPICSLLAMIGLITLRSLSSSYFFNQYIWIELGLVTVAAVVLLIRDPDRLGEYKYLAGIAGVILLLAPIFFGSVRGGSKLWLVVGGFSLQPSELAKIFLIVFLSAYLAEKKEVLATGRRRFLNLNWPDVRHFGPLVLMWIISLTILVFERDLGTSLIFFSLFLVLLYIATGRAAFTLVGVVLFLAGTFLAYQTFSHVAARVDVWLNPLPADVSGSSYQVAQSLFALTAGGVAGTGLGTGLLGRQILMPAIHTDFIFSTLSEELGLSGSAAILLVYILLVARGFHIAVKAKSDFSKLLAAGLATIIGIQAVVIIGGIIKLIPLTGITLPFISYGGSSIISSFIIVGLLLSISRQSHDAQT